MNKKKLLTIVIPQHSEDEIIITHLLSSINVQIGINFSEIDIKIIGDGGYKLQDDFFMNFENLNIQYIYYNESKGPGNARQIGLDIANSKYLSYMDADDQLNNINALWKFINVIKKTGDHDIIFSRYVEEHPSNSEKMNTYTLREFNPSASYGKWINIEYIRTHKLRWHPLLPYVYEDTFFFDSVLNLTNDIYYLDSPTYSWLYRANSIVRTGKDYNSFHINDYILENRLWMFNTDKRAPQNLYQDVNNGLVNIYHFMSIHKPDNSIKSKVNYELEKFFLENNKKLNANYSASILQDRFPELNVNQYRMFIDNWRHKLNLKQVVENHKNDSIFLSIIIPFYGEDESKLYSLILSIYNQVGFDLSKIEIIIIKDGGNNLNHSTIDKYNDEFMNLKIRYFHSKQNNGPGPARNIGIHHSNGQFIMFCDSDDQLHKIDSLSLMMNKFNQNNDAQIIMSKYVNEQVYENGVHYLAPWSYNYGAVYPTWYNLNFLRSYLIEFNSNLHSYYEDTFFVGIVSRLAKKIYFVDSAIYTHVFNNKSMIHSHSEKQRQSQFLIEYCKENYYWFEESRIRFPEYIHDDLNNFIISLYYMYYKYQIHSIQLDTEISEFLSKIVKNNKQYWDGWTDSLQLEARKRNSGDAENVSSKNLKYFIKKFTS